MLVLRVTACPTLPLHRMAFGIYNFSYGEIALATHEDAAVAELWISTIYCIMIKDNNCILLCKLVPRLYNKRVDSYQLWIMLV